MIGLEIKIKNNETGKEIFLNKRVGNEIIALQEYPVFASEIQEEKEMRLFRHGYFRLPSFYRGKSIVLTGLIVADTNDRVEEIKRDIEEVFILPKDGEGVTISFTYGGVTKRIEATLRKAISWNRKLKEANKLDFQIMLSSPSSFFIVDDPSRDDLVTIGTLGKKFTGISLWTHLPFTLSDKYLNIEPFTENLTYLVFPIVKLRADGNKIINPRFENLTTGDYIEFTYTLEGSDFIEMNFLTGEMKNANGKEVSGYASESKGDFRLASGQNDLLYTCSNFNYQNAHFEIKTKQISV